MSRFVQGASLSSVSGFKGYPPSRQEFEGSVQQELGDDEFVIRAIENCNWCVIPARGSQGMGPCCSAFA